MKRLILMIVALTLICSVLLFSGCVTFNDRSISGYLLNVQYQEASGFDYGYVTVDINNEKMEFVYTDYAILKKYENKNIWMSYQYNLLSKNKVLNIDVIEGIEDE